jgi:hypothetical protein
LNLTYKEQFLIIVLLLLNNVTAINGDTEIFFIIIT